MYAPSMGINTFSFYLYIVPRFAVSLADVIIINQKIYHSQPPDFILPPPDVHCLYFESTLWIIILFSTRSINACISIVIIVKVWSCKALSNLRTQAFLQKKSI